MATPTPLDPRDLMERYASRAPEPRLRDARVGPYMTGAALWVAGIFVLGPTTAAGLVLIPVGLGLAAGAAELLAQIVHRHSWQVWDRVGDAVDWADVHDRVIRDFRASIHRGRAAQMRPNTAVMKQRQALEAGRFEASRSVAFWTDAVEGEPDSESNQVQLRTAQELEEKLTRALDELNRRRERMAAFLEQCERKAEALAFSRRKLEESARLSSLADRTSQMISDTGEDAEVLGQAFLEEAASAFSALGGLERLHLSVEAGDLPLDSIEDVADRIVRSAEDEERALADLIESIDRPEA